MSQKHGCDEYLRQQQWHLRLMSQMQCFSIVKAVLMRVGGVGGIDVLF